MRTLLAAALLCGVVCAQGLPREPQREAGNSVTGAFEGWFRNPDGTFTLLLGYYNRNQKQELEIPIGPNNRIEPGDPDQGQPTHFMPGRGWGMFTIRVPADFGEKKYTWTLIANGQTTSIPASLKSDWEISPFTEAAVGNTPPVLSFVENGPSAQGPRPLMVEWTAKVGVPLSLNAWITDDGKFTTGSGIRPRPDRPPVTVRWIPYRAPGPVVFAQERPAVEKISWNGTDTKFTGKVTTTATFQEPGEYVLNLSVNDYSGDGGSGFQCCWTTGKVKVTVSR